MYDINQYTGLVYKLYNVKTGNDHFIWQEGVRSLYCVLHVTQYRDKFHVSSLYIYLRFLWIYFSNCYSEISQNISETIDSNLWQACPMPSNGWSMPDEESPWVTNKTLGLWYPSCWKRQFKCFYFKGYATSRTFTLYLISTYLDVNLQEMLNGSCICIGKLGTLVYVVLVFV